MDSLNLHLHTKCERSKFGRMSDAMEGIRISLIIDKISSSGGQRTLCRLAVHLKRRGYDVDVLTFRKATFFLDVLQEAGVPIVHVPSRHWPHLMFAMRREIRQSKPDVVIAFLEGANFLVELAGLPRRDFAVIATEFNTVTHTSLRHHLFYALHHLADAVVCNSHAQRSHINQAAPSLRQRTSVIVDGVDLAHFRPANSPKLGRRNRLRILVLARFHPQKNPFGLVAAAALVRKQHPALDLVIDWYGEIISLDRPSDSEWSPRRRREVTQYYKRLEDAIAERSLQDRFHLHDARKDVATLYQAADAVCLPSFYEGTPNVICEAMASGVPVLATPVGDVPRLVEDGCSGLLFDPASPQAIADAIVRFASMSPEARVAMGLAGRKVAEVKLSTEVFVDRYVQLIRRVIGRRRQTHGELSAAAAPRASDGKIKVAYVISTFRKCAPTNQLLNILRHIDYNQFEVSVITLSPEPADSIIDKAKTFPLTFCPLNLGRVSGIWRLKHRLTNAIKWIEPDILHSSGWRCDSIVSKLNRGAGWIATCRNLPHLDYTLKFGKLSGNCIAGSHVRALKKCRNLICCSNAMKVEYEQHYKISGAITIPDGVEFPQTNVNVNSAKSTNRVIRAVTAGSLIPRKNTGHLCEMFRRLPGSTAQLTILGDGPDRVKLSPYAYENIAFAGHQDDVYLYLADSDIYMSASVSEGLPNAVLEALSMGLPCILSDIGPHLELKNELPGIEIFSLSDSLDEIARNLPGCIERLMKIPRVKIREAVMEKYSARKMSERYQTLYMSLVEQSASNE